MSLRKIFHSPFLVKRSHIFKQYLCTYHACHVKAIAHNDNKTLAIENTNEDMLSMELNTLSTTKILLALENNKKLINGSHLVLAMKKFHKVYRKRFNRENESRIWNNPNAEEMCSVIDTNIHKLSIEEAVKLLNLFSKMKADVSMKVMQSLLQHIKDNVRQLTLVDFRTLSSSLKQMPQSSLTKDLNHILERRFIVQVATEFDPDNIEQIESALYFTVNHLDNNKLLQLFISKLSNFKDMPSNIATSIFHSFCFMKQYPSGWLEVLQKIQNVLIEKVDELSTNQILFILFLIGEKYRLNRNENFYNERLCEKLVKKIITNDDGFEIALSALKSLSYIRFVSVELMNYTCAAYFERTNLSSESVQDEFFKLVTLIGCLSSIKHKSVFFEEIKDSVLNSNQLLKCNYESLCILTLNLINLDCYPDKLLSKLFDSKSTYSDDTGFLHWTFCKVYQKIKTNPTYKGPLPSESQIALLTKFFRGTYFRKKSERDRFSHYLKQEMGGPAYVKSVISTKLFHLIDYAVAFDKKGSPIPINANSNDDNFNSVEYVEDLKLPPGSQIVLILLNPSHWYSKNTHELFSTYSCTKETLEALSYIAVNISERTWAETPFEERSAMLMSKIYESIKT